MAYQIRSNLHLPYGGEREGAEVHWQSNLFLPLGKVRMGYPWGRNKLLLQITISPHLASPVGEGLVTLYLNFRQPLQPPLVLPRRGDAGYSSSVKDWEMQVTPVLSKIGRCRLLRI